MTGFPDALKIWPATPSQLQPASGYAKFRVNTGTPDCSLYVAVNGVGVFVRVAVGIGVFVKVGIGVGLLVKVGENVLVGEGIEIGVLVNEGETVGVKTFTPVGVETCGVNVVGKR